MANYNRVILAGNLTRDPQLSYLPSNTPVCEFGMAINRKWKAQTGEMRDETCFVELKVFGRQAETINQYMSKGRPLLVEGRLKYDQWEGKDGGKRSKLYVVADSFQFLGSPSGGGGGGGSSRSNSSRGEATRPASNNEQNRGYAPRDDSDQAPPMEDVAPGGEEIPF